MTLIIYLTGGIGAGKSTVSDLFSKLKVPIIDADHISRELTGRTHSRLFKQIFKHFGPNYLDPAGNLNRAKLREYIFNFPAEKQWLENLLHPVIYKIIQTKLCRIFKAQKSGKKFIPYMIIVLPLLFETGGNNLKNKNSKNFTSRILVVDSPRRLQLERIQARDNMTQSQIKKILRAQFSRKQRLQKADDVILNINNKNALKKQVLDLHQRYFSKSLSSLSY